MSGVIPFLQLADMLNDAGFPAGTSQLDGIAIVCAESGRDPGAKHENLAADGVTVLSTDRGLWQINDKAHPDVSDEDAYDPVKSTAAALKISTNGHNYGPWSTFGNGAYRAHLEAAAVALDGALKVRRLTAQLASATSSLTDAQAQVSAIQAKLDEAEGMEASDEQEIEALKATVSSLQGKIAAAQQALS